jgi:hypothetical protein
MAAPNTPVATKTGTFLNTQYENMLPASKPPQYRFKKFLR